MYQPLTDLICSLRKDTPAFEDVAKYIYTRTNGVAPRVLTMTTPSGGHVIFLTQPRANTRGGKLSPLAMIAGGIVLDYPSMDVLALPPPPLVDRFDKRAVIENFSSYTIEHAVDGTQVTAYWNNRWKLSTVNGYDVSGLKWFGGLTFMEAVVSIVGAEFFSTLDTNFSHTFVFKHPQFHPLEADTPRVHSVVSVDVGKFSCDGSYVAAPGPFPPLPRYTLLPNMTPADHYRSLVNINRNSLYGLIRLKTTPRYGFVLRSNVPGQPNIIIRSELGTFLRENVYNVPENEALTPENKLDFMILRAWLSYNTRFILGDLMPARTGPLYKKFTQFIASVTKLIIAGSDADDKYHTLATAMGEKMIEDGINFDQLDPGAESQIADYLTDPKFADIYLSVL